MNRIPRRGVLGTAALAMIPQAVLSAEPAMYDYLFLELDDAAPAVTPARAYAEHACPLVA
jgi:hypothetical protein